ncbi:MAG TPA: SRPBCC family protein [Burkholderiales bacterium]|nr:SRPBCC family protein [Burkholderiales bacterium]
MLKIILLAVAVLVGGLLAYAATRPDSFRVERTASIQAPPERVFPFIDDFRSWPAWSPWEKKDPAMKRTLGATTRGPGATYAWDGDKNVGKGSMEIAESVEPSRVRLRLDFERPFEAHNRVEFRLEPRGGATHVSWAMEGPMPFISKLMSVFMDFDRMIGADFEAGLAALKAAAEKPN